MTKRNRSLILSIALLGSVLSPLYGQSESALKQFFEGKITVVRIDMPGSYRGVDIYPKRADSIDWEEYRRELKKYGTALPEGQEATITLIKTKSNHIEFQLDGGGWGDLVMVEEHRSERELESRLFRPTDPDKLDERASLERSLESVRRTMEEEQRAWNKSRRAGGSRFNIRYESRMRDGDRTPESVMAALSEYLDFPPETFDVPEPMTNDDIVKMAQAQLSINIIVTNMKSADSVKFDLSPEGLIALTDAGVDDRVTRKQSR